MNINNAEFLTSVYDYNKLPELVLPEIVFVGRSNVGKSSMINKLLNRKSIARISSSPGKTACINYYNIDNKLYFTDLPGYGFAKVSKEEQKRWSLLIDGYFSICENISLVILLLDIRHKPSNDDFIMYNYLINMGIDFVITLTKCDKLSNNQLINRKQEMKKELLIKDDSLIIPFSSVKGDGVNNLWDILKAKVEENEIHKN